MPFPPPGDLPNPGIEPRSPAWAGRFFTADPPGKPRIGVAEGKKKKERKTEKEKKKKKEKEKKMITNKREIRLKLKRKGILLLPK